METKQHVTKIHWANEEVKEEIRKYFKTNENGNNFSKFMGCSKSISKWEVYSDIGLPHEIRKISNKQPNLQPKGIRKRTNKAESQQKEGNNNDQRRN